MYSLTPTSVLRIMPIRDPPIEDGKVPANPTNPSPPSSNQMSGASRDVREISSYPSKASKLNTRRSRGQEEADDHGAIPVIPSKAKTTSSNVDEKQQYKLELAPGTSPYSLPFATRSTTTEPALPDSDLAAKDRKSTRLNSSHVD